MDVSAIYSLLTSSNIPVAHNIFKSPQNPPYLIYRNDSFENIAANGKTVLKKQRITIELYVKITQVNDCERAVEDILDGFTTYTKERAFDDAQGLYITYYSFYEVITT